MDVLRCLFILAVTVTFSRSECPDGWTKYHTSCYLFSHLKLNFFDAENFCNQEGGYLVHINTRDENAFLKSYCDDLKVYQLNHGDQLVHLPNVPVFQAPGLPTTFLQVNRRWIGMTDQVVENNWLWHGTHNSPTFFDWAAGEPNQAKGANCGVLWETHSYEWADNPCSYKYESICERGPSIPSTTINDDFCILDRCFRQGPRLKKQWRGTI